MIYGTICHGMLTRSRFWSLSGTVEFYSKGRVCSPNVLYHISSRDGCSSTSISPGCTYSKELYSVSFYQPLRCIQAMLASTIKASKSAYLWELFLPTGYGRRYLRFILCFQESFNVLRGDNVFEDY